MTKLAMLDTTVQKTHEWLRDVKDGLGFDNDRAAYAALRATLHALRDQLATDQVAQFGAQLPTLVRGVYYEGWNPDSHIDSGSRRPDLLDAVRRELREHLELHDAERVARIVFEVLAMHVTLGEIGKIVKSLPREIRALWPQPAPQNAQ
ncbi:MAG: DUF2267 domain-containing protein [Alphaproteobacteria bacterium]|nr:DUF2267 domain-containing protein [Alphaproteobacteria bacterium]